MICETVRNINSRTGSKAITLGISSGATRVRRKSASRPSEVAKLNTRSVVAHRSDQARFSFSGQREDAQEIDLVEIDVQFAICRGAGGFDIGDIENLPIGAAGKAGADRLAHRRACSVATRNVLRLAVNLLTAGPVQASRDAVFPIGEVDQFGSPLDFDAERSQSFDQ